MPEMDQIEVEIPAAEAKRIQEFINRNLTEIAEEIEEFLDAEESMYDPSPGVAAAQRREAAIEVLRARVDTIRRKHG